jgi:putative protein-disulfide isomerase
MENNIDSAVRAEIVYYTDPLCCWSWAMRPHLQKCKEEFGEMLRVRLCMGGLLPSWQKYHDLHNNVSKPVQMGPIWMEASHLTGATINNRIWIEDPPRSSYLACMAVKCAGMQSENAEEEYFHALQKAVMVKGINISYETALINIAKELNAATPGLIDADLLKEDLNNGSGLEAFRKDLQEVLQRQIMRFPSLIFRRCGRAPVMLTGYRPYDILSQTITALIAQRN